MNNSTIADEVSCLSVASGPVSPWGGAPGIEEDQNVVGGDVKPVDTSRFQSSIERNLWGKRHPIWKNNRVLKPRLCTGVDQTADWVLKLRPSSFKDLMGLAKEECMAHLQYLVAKKTFKHVLLCGPVGSGKSSLAECYVREYLGEDNVQSSVLRLYPKTVTENEYEMKPKFEAMVAGAPVAKRGHRRPSRAVIIEQLCHVGPAAQNTLAKCMDEYNVTTRFVITCEDQKKIQNRIHKACVVLQTTSPAIITIMLDIILRACLTERVGFEREGLKTLLHTANGDMRKAVIALHKVFVQTHYVSQENVTKTLFPNRRNQKPVIPVTASLHPLSRCAKCTLYPPCPHLSQAELIERALQRRKELPRYRDALVCGSYSKTGACALFNSHGHCSLDHPKDIHVLKYPISRCELCTLPKPCGVCRHEKAKARLRAYVAGAKLRVGELQKKLSAPHGFVPPLVLERLKQEALKELARLDGEVKRLDAETETSEAFYDAMLPGMKDRAAVFLARVDEHDIEEHPQEEKSRGSWASRSMRSVTSVSLKS